MESNKMSLGKQISWIIVLVSVLLVVSATLVAVIQIKSSLMTASQDKISEILELTYNVVDGFNKEVQKGELTKAEAQKEAIHELNKFRYQGYNYVWINDYDTIFIVHPTNPVGSDGKKIADPDGKHFFKDLTDLAKSGEKSYLSYKWTKPGMGANKYFPKTSTAITYPAWGWVLATGVYVDEIDKIVNHTIIILVSIDLILLVILLILTQLFFVKKLEKEMNNITDEMENGANQVGQASRALEQASVRLAEGSNEQAASIQEIAATIEESASMVTKNNENSNYAAILVKEVTDKAVASHQKMDQMMKAMEKINNSSNEISKIIKLIDEIAFQTNILALNAAVEAARAGDAGKGFAVVAEEVRNLAQRSTVSAKDTTKLIDENISLSQEGSTLANDVYISIDEIDAEINKVNGLVQEVSVSSQEQLLGIQQIQTAINQMEQVLQMNAQTADTNSEASQELSAQTNELNNLIEQLAVIIEGSKK